VLDLGRVYVPETYLLPQLAGGIVFGAGFVIAGLCPGTSCVAAATGRGDGALVMLGMFAGVLVTGFAFAPLQHFYESTSRGSLTLPDVLHVPYGVVVCAVVGMALIAFRFVAPHENRRRAAGGPAGEPPALRALPALRWGLATAAAILGILALFGSHQATQHPTLVSPVQLAEWIRDRKPGLRVIDLRTEEQFDEYHLPRAERFDRKALPSFKPSETVVIVSGSEQVPGDRQGYILRGGLKGWLDDVMNPTITADASPADRAAFQRASVVSRYFGGVPRVVDKSEVKVSNSAAAIRRRGC
jgi:uncharacterized membrane protein YedE/YeeE